ncbi:transcriptional regulator of acetoin/glycerol metabolism [Methylopila capsulata]|uniref:Transcriptional regulator of acetoin/glycerol metabolism n=1 Tax=Methylopila capsulata TaxID=61654 RepID=A0A9W6MS45_9HYPH|nr:hypothetical protein [Methylopila capsulata]MBM7850608.1 transcriptional regulator of acetoin/glycerol metabolism [Methylopila capsulata]GLK55902.1 hypothetical protein GCM10008170_19210 [Methylopila capsulata]
MPAFRAHSREEIQRARTLYEETEAAPADIARLMGLGVNTFYRRVKQWGWRRRRLRVEESDAIAEEAVRSEAERLEDARLAAEGRAWLDSRRTAAERAEAAILGQIAAIEGMQLRAAQAALDLIDSERAARTLLRLAQGLNEVRKLKDADARADATAASRGQRAPETEPGFDVEAMRNELRCRIEAMRAAHAAGEG